MKLSLQGIAAQVAVGDRNTPKQDAIVIANLMQDEVLRTEKTDNIQRDLWRTNLLELALVEELKKRKFRYVGDLTRKEVQAARTTLSPEHHLGDVSEAIWKEAKEVVDGLVRGVRSKPAVDTASRKAETPGGGVRYRF